MSIGALVNQVYIGGSSWDTLQSRIRIHDWSVSRGAAPNVWSANAPIHTFMFFAFQQRGLAEQRLRRRQNSGGAAAEQRRNQRRNRRRNSSGTPAQPRRNNDGTAAEQRRNSYSMRSVGRTAEQWDFGLAGWGGRRNSVGTVAEQLRNSCGTTAEQLRNNGGTAGHCTQGEVVG